MFTVIKKGGSKEMKRLHTSFRYDNLTQIASLNMSDFRPKKSLVFSGRPEGLRVRNDIKLEMAEKKSKKIIIEIPLDTISFNPSFFLGMFGKSISIMGKEKFLEIYEFRCSDHIKKNIYENIEFALKVSNPLIN